MAKSGAALRVALPVPHCAALHAGYKSVTQCFPERDGRLAALRAGPAMTMCFDAVRYGSKRSPD